MERPVEEEVFLIALEEFILQHGGKPNPTLINAVMGKLVVLDEKNVPPPSILRAVSGDIGVMLDNLTNDSRGARLLVFVQMALIRLLHEHGIEMVELPEGDKVWIMGHAWHLPNLAQNIQRSDPDLSKLKVAMEKVCEHLERIPWAQTA